MKTHNEVEQRRSMADIPMIGDMSITDEHKLVPLKTKMKVILNILKKEPSTAVILHDGKGKKMKIVGVITAEEVEAAINKGKKPKKLKVDDVTLTKILELPSNIPITKALEVIQNKGPDAVIVRNYESRDFAGFFSVDDFREAKGIISQQKQRAQEFQQNTQSTMQKSALQQEMEDDDDSYVPEAMRSLPLSPELKATFKTQAEEGSVKTNSDKTPVDYSAQVKLDDYICKRCNSVFTNENDLKQHSSWDPETQTIVCLDEKNDGPNDSPLSVPWEEGPSNQEELECPFCAEPASRNVFVSLRKCPVCDETLSTEDLQTMITNAQEATEEDESIFATGIPPNEEERDA
ncbi:MAG: CBS domain-containing protein, partial [Euryarchaeota archaeon]|nr:CBS domain-containing protein [Euryarchaeota archaeon]